MRLAMLDYLPFTARKGREKEESDMGYGVRSSFERV